jgi:ribosome maturation factor RimP
MVQVFAEKLKGIQRAPLEAAITPVLRAHGVESAEVSYQMEPSGWVLRVTVESLDTPGADGPEAAPLDASQVNLGLLSEISRDLSSALDVADIIPHHYNLEVSSPGLERPLRSARDYQRAIGHLAKVHLVTPAPDGQKVLRGHIVACDADTATLEVDGKPVTAHLANIERAHLVFELAAQPKGARPKAGKHPRN